jgi:hypothetical protein
MLTIKKLKELIKNLPDEASIKAYEGEGCGLQVYLGEKSGWIETGYDDQESNDKRHDLDEFNK